MNFNDYKDTIKPLLEKYCKVSAQDAEEMIINESETLEGELLNELLGGNAEQDTGVYIEGLDVEGKEFVMNIGSAAEENGIFVLLSFGCCTDAVRASEAISRYGSSDFAESLCIENLVEEEGDVFALSCVFEAENTKELSEGLERIFGIMQDGRFKELLLDILENFD